VARLRIDRFRGIKFAELHFDGHTLLLGPNNVGKTTVFEALDLVLGADRLPRTPPIEEFDFYNADYVAADGSKSLSIEVVLTDLTPEVTSTCRPHLEFWVESERRILDAGELDAANPGRSVPCLRLQTLGRYDAAEDEFVADTYFAHGSSLPEGALEKVGRGTKRLFGFIHLRALRTASRALSLERGSLLDVILRMRKSRAGLWEGTLSRLRSLDPPLG
jgi:putative ATP-dependent endonuclease of OLD family